MADRVWVKLWATYWTSLSHDSVGPDALLVGCVLMSSVRWRPGDVDAWAVSESGRPVPVSTIARRSQLPAKRVMAALEDLAVAGTARLREDGAWGLPNFGLYQETADAARKRKLRGQSNGHSDGQSESVSGTFPAEGEAEVDADACSLRSHLPAAVAPVAIAPPLVVVETPPKPKRTGKSKPRTDYPDGLAEHFLAELQAACETLGKRGPRKLTDHHRDDLRKLYAAHEPTPEDISHVVAVRRAMDARGEGYGFLTWESICVPGNFARWLSTPLDAAPAKPKHDTEAPFGRRPLTGKPYTSAQDREEWQRVDAANARRREALRGG